MTLRFGLLLPHFGEHADAGKIIAGSQRAEELGFDSVWVRDHLIFEPHGEFEKPNRAFYEALTVLTAVGASTSRLQLGTGALIPFRHPLQTALVTSTMTQFFGDRLILGMGGGTFDHEFEAVGLGGIFRPDLVESNAHILREVWHGNGVSYADELFRFDDVTIEPKPAGDGIPYWYCGNTPASARRAVAYCDGWIPGRISLATLRQRIVTLEELSTEQGRDSPSVGIIPSTSVERERDHALSYVNVDGLLEWANGAKYWVKPPAGQFRSVADLDGVLLAGTPDEVAAQCRTLGDAGVDHIVFDCRFKFERWFEQIEMLGTEVVAQLRDPERSPTRAQAG